MQDTKQLFFGLLNNHPQAHFALTDKGVLAWQNAALPPMLDGTSGFLSVKNGSPFFSTLFSPPADNTLKERLFRANTFSPPTFSFTLTLKENTQRFDIQLLRSFEDEKNETLFIFYLRADASEKVLRSYQKRYKEVVETQQELICRAKLDTTLTFVNEAYCRYFGKAEAELLGQPFLTFVPEAERDNALANFQRVLIPPHVVKYEHAVTDNKGQTRWHRWTDRLVENEEGEPEVQSVGLDITDLKETQLRLAESEARLNYAVENTKLIIWDWNILTGEVVSNDEWYTMLGYTRSELPSTTEAWTSTIHPEDQEEALQKVQEHLSGKSANYQIEKRLKHKEGHWIWVLSSGKVVTFTKDGKPARMVGIMLDITERKIAEERLWESEYRYRTVVETISKGIVLQNKDGKIETCNPAAEQILGLSRAQMEGKTSIDPLWRCIHQDGSPFPGEDHPAMVSLRTGKPVRGVTMGVYKPDGSLTWILVKSTPLFQANKTEPYAVVALFNDITEVVKNEEALRVAVNEAKKASQAKSSFLANMSHEIRTPLNGIIGFADLLLQGSFTEEQAEYLHAIRQSADALMGIINDILDFSKIEAGKLELAPEVIDLQRFTQTSITPIYFQAKKKNLKLSAQCSPDTPTFVIADGNRLRQVLLNLLSNAVKFTEKGEVKLEVEYLGQKNANEVLLRFSVTDTGIGIAPQNQKRIFEAFTQEDSSTTKHFGGTGLGLSISNSLLQLMGSELALKSALGRGSSFYFDIALAIHAEEAYTAHDFSALSPILVVDDQKENCDVLLEILQLAGISAEAVQQGIAAIAKLEKKKYPLVLMDYHMPYMNGLNTAQYIHEKMGEDAPEIILLSSSEEDEEIQHAGHMRYVRERLAKPIQSNALYNCLARIAKHPRSPQPLNAQKAIQKVLIVDDHHVNAILSERILQNILPNAQLKTAANGKEALETFKTFVPDLVLMDIQMPIMNGYDATRAIRLLPEGQAALIFALTAGTLKGEAQKCIGAGMNDYLSKPITQDKLLFKIKEWLHFQVEGTAAADKTHEDEQADVLSQVQNLPSFNIERLRTLLDGDEGLLLHLLGEASAFLSTSLPELKSDYAKQNEKELNRKLHKLRGTALNLYFERLAALAAAFEAIAPEDATRPSLFHAILNEVQLLQRKVQEYQI